MEKIITQLQLRAEMLKKAISEARLEEGSFPEGRLRVSNGNNRVRFFHMTQYGDTQGEYITKENRNIAERLAQKEYNRCFLIKAQKELDSIERFISFMLKENADTAYDSLSVQRRKLVSPYVQPDELYIREWQSQDFIPNPYMAKNLIYDTKKGEKVRSKSEAILADMLFELGIPYHYEKPLYLAKGVVKYPDFSILHVPKREVIYLEHFGLLDNEEYLAVALRKLDEYRKFGIFPGKNLLFTYETPDNPLDINGIRKMLKEICITR